MSDPKFSEYCANCRKSLTQVETILFVEKELGRCFCAEECIKDYFQPTVDFMAEELAKLRSEGDFTDSESMRYSHYQSLTLGDPDEVWVDETETGERHFTYIMHFRQGEERVSYLVVCLTIEGVPSFVLMSFATRDEDLVDEYRRGIDLRIDAEEVDSSSPSEQQSAPLGRVDALDGPGLEASEHSSHREEAAEHEPSYISDLERLYSELRQAGDIPREDFPKYESLIEATIDEPDEIWRLVDDEGNEWCTFIARHYGGEEGLEDVTMIAICEPAMEETSGGAPSFEIVFAFPTMDPGLVQHFRKGINSLNKAFGVGWTRGRAA